ncbi:hypothetical protein ACQR0Z_05690 [Bradyrhizobium sp. HKCCYLS3077]|uniref:hypothetical protein n=1 Tax=Bradyrhizobium sp. HKCCYLS3077 TaxID=3420761 RepID=UPI003EB6D865
MRWLLCLLAIAVALSPALGEDVEGLEPAAPPQAPASSPDPQVVSAIAPGAQLPARPAGSSVNPLWDVPIATLSAMRDRPIFSASRRPPELPAVAPVVEMRAPPPPPSEPERPNLQLVGTVVGGEDSFAIFIDPSSQAALRLRMGTAHEGWTLQSLQARQAVLQKDGETVTLAMPQPSETASSDSDSDVDAPPPPTGRERMARRSR